MLDWLWECGRADLEKMLVSEIGVLEGEMTD